MLFFTDWVRIADPLKPPWRPVSTQNVAVNLFIFLSWLGPVAGQLLQPMLGDPLTYMAPFTSCFYLLCYFWQEQKKKSLHIYTFNELLRAAPLTGMSVRVVKNTQCPSWSIEVSPLHCIPCDILLESVHQFSRKCVTDI